MKSPPQAYRRWLETYAIAETVQPLLSTILSWTGRCSPPNADASALALACMDLTGVFYLDDCPPSEADQHLDNFESLLKGDTPKPTAPAIYHAYRELLTRVQSSCSNRLFSQYLAGRQKLVCGYRRRRALTRTGDPICFADYLELRMATIFVDQWIDLWEALGGFKFTESERVSVVVVQTRRALSHWHVFENELSSESRDARDNVPNLVRIDAAERGVQIADARKNVTTLAEQSEKTLTERTEQLCSTAHDESFTGFIGLVKSCHQGGSDIYRHVDPSRYTSRV